MPATMPRLLGSSLALLAWAGTSAADANDEPLMVNPCRDPDAPYAKMPFCNAALSIDDRVTDIISRLSLNDKIGLMDQQGVALPQLGLHAYRWWEEATHGIQPPRNGNTTPFETNFAFPITTGMSFNRTMWRKTGQQIAREARAFANAGDEYSTFWTPVVNLAREPRWGRNLETPGEDPYLNGEYATHFVKGFQEDPEDPGHVLGSACCKHYVANEMEHSVVAGFESDREHFNANVSTQDLVDSYMAPFQACVERGQVTSLMCSYNSVNGIPTCASDWLLTTVARKAWGFDGAIVSDCDADSDVYNSHHYTATPEESVRDVLRAGTDVDCGGFVTAHAKSALEKGWIVESDLDDRLRQQFRLRMRLGHFDPLGPLDDISPAEVCSPYAIALMRDGAAQSANLLKNEGGALPLTAVEGESVAVLGPISNLDSRTSLTGYYGGPKPCGMKLWTLADGIREHVSDVREFLGVPNFQDNSDPDPAAVTAAKEAGKVVLGLGTDLSLAREGQDATHLELSEGQKKLWLAVAEAAKSPIVVVMLTAVPLDISELLAHPKVGAVLHTGQPSTAVVGLGDVLFGRKSPAGRAIQTVYPKEYADEVSIFDFNMRPGLSNWPRPDCRPKDGNFSNCPKGTNPGRTHRFYVGQPVVPFGFGLSYTRFGYELVSAPIGSVSLVPVHEMLHRSKDEFFVSHLDIMAAGQLAKYAVKVTNLGGVDSDDVVLGFLTPPGAGKNGIPLQTLFGFERVHVKAGESATVWLYPSAIDFTQVDINGKRRVVAGEYRVHFGVERAAAHGMGYLESQLSTVDKDSVEFI